ncbi:MAG: hypothetical protein HOW73_32230 [Polyangiaceae bacterium]|nr:hypothetical protein [Polyangiaceae bacterium]
MSNQFPGDFQAARPRAAFHAARDQINQIPDDRLIPIKVDIETAITTVLGCAPHLEKLRPEVASALPGHGLGPYDNVELYALALSHAHSLHKAAARPPEPIPALVAAATVVRTRLVTDIIALVERGRLPKDALQKLRGTTGFSNLGYDLLFVSTLLRENWETIQAKTAIESAELDNAEELADRLTTAVGLREHAVKARLEATRTRHQAFTLFERSYQEVRRIVAFVRYYEGDAERIAPSIYRGRGGRGKTPKSVSNGAASPAPTAPVANANDGPITPSGESQ